MADVLWRDTALTPKIFILDARAVFPLALWLFIGPGGRLDWRLPPLLRSIWCNAPV